MLPGENIMILLKIPFNIFCKKIKEIGYSNLELAGYGNRKMGQYEVEAYRKIVDDSGLKKCYNKETREK